MGALGKWMAKNGNSAKKVLGGVKDDVMMGRKVHGPPDMLMGMEIPAGDFHGRSGQGLVGMGRSVNKSMADAGIDGKTALALGAGGTAAAGLGGAAAAGAFDDDESPIDALLKKLGLA